MTRKVALALIIAAGVALIGVWLALPLLLPEAPRLAGLSRGPGDSVEDLMMDLQIIPIDPRPARAFSLETLDGKRLALAELAGRPLLLYFWASW